jgi:hypothetical protein
MRAVVDDVLSEVSGEEILLTSAAATATATAGYHEAQGTVIEQAHNELEAPLPVDWIEGSLSAWDPREKPSVEGITKAKGLV